MLALRLPAAKRKVDAQLAEAQLKIENSLVAKGPDVVRHLVLPIEGRSPEWIAQEMEKMDNETEKHEKWKMGRLSGAVYRESRPCSMLRKMLGAGYPLACIIRLVELSDDRSS